MRPVLFAAIVIPVIAAGISLTVTGLISHEVHNVGWGLIGGSVLASLAYAIVYFTHLRPRDPEPEWSLERVANYILGHSNWIPDDPSRPGSKVINLLDALSRQAALGQITVWGSKLPIPARRRNSRLGLAKIPVDHWSHYRIDIAKFLGEREAVSTLMGSNPDGQSYYDLSFDSRQIKRLRNGLRHLQADAARQT